MADDVSTEKVSTDQLRPGDLVLHYGMRIRLGELETYPSCTADRVYRFPGTVENKDEVLRPGHVTTGFLGADGQWSVQGNNLATWFRVVE
ncbi:hypothetical protein [Amycolatopsis sp. NPDC004079]|uniref:hypothetical protein n=1 Tax=Amycolatopsis sp. NPDC004079 TaxID=3154549 RepID=UPI0033B479C4